MAIQKLADTSSVAEVEASLSTQREGCGIIVGDASQLLSLFAQNTFRCCITSPPYWGLRDYGVDQQIGAEESVDEYVGKLVLIFRQVRRVLTEDGTLWLNLGDSYTSGGRTWRDGDRKNPARAMGYRPPTPEGLKPKDLVGVPWRLAFALQADGWYLRSDIIWYKPNCQPESVKDRPTRAHEYIFMFSKSERYFYDYDASKEPCGFNGTLRNRRTVWAVNTEGFPDAHFATFPPALVEPCLALGSEAGDKVLDPFFGSGTVGEVCVKMNRLFTGIEIKEEYANIARRRLGFGLSHCGETTAARQDTRTPCRMRCFRPKDTSASQEHSTLVQNGSET